MATIGLLALLILGLAAGAVLLGGSPRRDLPKPFGLAANGLVVYSVNGDIYTVDPASTVARAVVTGPDLDQDPVWSDDPHVVTLSSTFGSSRFPRPLDDRRFLVAGPARHCDAEELERVDTGAAILECRPDGNVDGNASPENGRLLTSAVSSPYLPLAGENVPELAHGGVDGRPIHLTWRDGGVDHAAGLAFDQVPDLGPGRGAAIRGGRERAGLHGEPPCASKHYPRTDASVALGLRVSFPHAGGGRS